MKIRQAKKIQSQYCLPLKGKNRYWRKRYQMYLCASEREKVLDHRITKAINLSAKCKARDMLHNIEKNCCRTPFNQKNVESCRRKVESYKV